MGPSDRERRKRANAELVQTVLTWLLAAFLAGALGLLFILTLFPR